MLLPCNPKVVCSCGANSSAILWTTSISGSLSHALSLHVLFLSSLQFLSPSDIIDRLPKSICSCLVESKQACHYSLQLTVTEGLTVLFLQLLQQVRQHGLNSDPHVGPLCCYHYVNRVLQSQKKHCAKYNVASGSVSCVLSSGLDHLQGYWNLQCAIALNSHSASRGLVLTSLLRQVLPNQR